MRRHGSKAVVRNCGRFFAGPSLRGHAAPRGERQHASALLASSAAEPWRAEPRRMAKAGGVLPQSSCAAAAAAAAARTAARALRRGRVGRAFRRRPRPRSTGPARTSTAPPTCSQSARLRARAKRAGPGRRARVIVRHCLRHGRACSSAPGRGTSAFARDGALEEPGFGGTLPSARGAHNGQREPRQ